MKNIKDYSNQFNVNLPIDLFSDLKLYLIMNNINTPSEIFNNSIPDIYINNETFIDEYYEINKDSYKLKRYYNREQEVTNRLTIRLNSDITKMFRRLAVALNKTYSDLLRYILKKVLVDNQINIDDFYTSNNDKLIELDELIKEKDSFDFNIKLTDSNLLNIKHITNYSIEYEKDVIFRIIKEYIDKVSKITDGNFDYYIFNSLDYNFNNIVNYIYESDKQNYLKLNKFIINYYIRSIIKIEKYNYRCMIRFHNEKYIFNSLSILCKFNNVTMNFLINIILTEYFNKPNFISHYYETNKKKQ